MSSGRFRSDEIDGGEADSDPASSAGRYYLRIGPRQIELHRGDTFIGRDETCHVAISGALVSRRHARILLEEGELSLEDLGSRNGTFLNGAMVQGRVPIRPGDRLFVGSFDIDVVRLEGASPPSGVTGDSAFDRATPSSGVALARKLSATGEEERAAAATKRSSAQREPDLDTIESAGRLAERMFVLGRPLAGRDLLSEPLKRVLAALQAGRHLDPVILDATGRWAMKLALEVFDANWLNLAVEIHLLAGHPMKRETLEQIISLRKKAPIGDDELIARYHGRVCMTIGVRPLAERLLHAELVGEDPPSDDDE